MLLRTGPFWFWGSVVHHPVSLTPCYLLSWTVPGGSLQVTSASPFISPPPLMFLLLHSVTSFSTLCLDHQSLPCNRCSRVPGRPVAIILLLLVPYLFFSLASLPGFYPPGSFTSIHITLSSRARSTCTFLSSLHCPLLPSSASFPSPLSTLPFLLPPLPPSSLYPYSHPTPSFPLSSSTNSTLTRSWLIRSPD